MYKIVIATLAFFTFNSFTKTKCLVFKINLSDTEKADILFLREEEKLAHDIYTYSFKKYNQPIFSNIMSAELTHMNSVLTLLKKYNLKDPIQNNEEGVFLNTMLQQQYNQLKTKSDSSLTKALEVGATIEDLDISDIKRFISHTNNSDLLNVYSKLTCGSRNHLRSFVSQLSLHDILYSPHYLTPSEFNKIITSSKEYCGAANGTD